MPEPEPAWERFLMRFVQTPSYLALPLMALVIGTFLYNHPQKLHYHIAGPSYLWFTPERPEAL